MKKSLVLFLFCLFPAAVPVSQNREPSVPNNQNAPSSLRSVDTSLFQVFAQSIRDSMTSNTIPGLSIAVVSRDSVLWIESFGVTGDQSGDRVDNETIFSLQSISKTVTATAVLFAVQEGLVSLDAPITEYLPDFRVNSRFEEHPERKMTLRHLLSHRAGFTHEAPVGNNYQTEFDSFEQHIQSISDTWLKAPVGKLYSYSNLGIDLAGYILQVRSGMPFADYVKSRLFFPLEMVHSSFDWTVTRTQTNRAIGHNKRFSEVPLEYAMIPSGACYTCTEDMAHFIQFHLSRGKYKNRILLDEKYLDEMYTIPFSREVIGYGLGIDMNEKAGGRCYGHGGGGFGFLTAVQWLPHLDIGVAVLTNSSNHNNVQWAILDTVVNRLKHDEIALLSQKSAPGTGGKPVPIELTDEEYEKYSGEYTTLEGSQTYKVVKNGSRFGAQGGGMFIPFQFFSRNGDFFVEGFGAELDGQYRICMDESGAEPVCILNKLDGAILYFNERLSPGPGPEKAEGNKYTGKFSRMMYGQIIASHEISVKNGYLYFDSSRMRELAPGLFYLPSSEVVDFRGEIPTIRNMKLFKEG